MSKMEPFSHPLVFAFGGGADGTAALAKMAELGIIPDLIQFADTGNRDAEKPETYAHVDRMDGWCREKFGIGITWVRNDGMYAGLEDNCLQKHMLPSIAYGFKSCSDKYKRRPQEKFCKTWEPAMECWARSGKVAKIIGYNADEWHRQHSISEDAHYSYRYLLIELGITRRMVEEICLGTFGYVPIKSACKFCPSSKKSEVKWLARVHPEQFAECVAMERKVDYSSKDHHIECDYCQGSGLRPRDEEYDAASDLPGGKCAWCMGFGYFEAKGNTVRGLGRNWSWEELVKADEQQFKLFPEAPEAPCMCFDGGCELGTE